MHGSLILEEHPVSPAAHPGLPRVWEEEVPAIHQWSRISASAQLGMADSGNRDLRLAARTTRRATGTVERDMFLDQKELDDVEQQPSEGCGRR